eukprot:gene4076-5102_t
MEYNNEDLQRIPLSLIEKMINFMVSKLHPNHLSFKIDEIIHQIYERLAGSFRNARWLKIDKTLAFYEIDSNETLEFKNTKTVLKIRFNGPWERVVHPLHQSAPVLLDETIKTFIVDESKTVSEISQELARKLCLKSPEELSLKVILNRGDDIRNGVPGSSSSVSSSSSSSSSSSEDGDDEDAYCGGVWLASDLTLPEQNVDPLYSTFLLKRQFFFCKDTIIDFSMNPEMLHFVFCQCLDAIIDSSHPCTVNESILFAALQCQICFGDYSNPKSDFDQIRLKDFLPSDYVNQKSIIKEIIVQYQKLVGMTEEKAKLNYIQLAKSLKTYGYTFFKVRSQQSSSQSSILFGISPQAILLLDRDTKNTISLYSINNIKKWQVLNNIFSIEFSDISYVFTTNEAEAISHVLSSYIHYNLRNSPSVQKQWDLDYNSVGGRNSSSSRKRLSTCSIDSLNDTFNKDSWKNQNGIKLKKCPLYVEPKKLYINPLNSHINGPICKKELYKDTKVTKVLRVLTDLSSKMIQSFSKTSPAIEREIVVNYILNSSNNNNNNDEIFSSGGTWLKPYQPLSEQGVPADSKLLFKKKFYSCDTAADDCNNDPVYFNLLFFQSKDAIISNTYSCSKEEAIQLAATLFQINFGDHNPTIHKPGFLKAQDLKFFLPPDSLELWGLSFQKIERSIYKEHRNLRGIKEVYAKYRYVQLCRSLKTFGAIFYSVKQSSKEKNHPLLPSSNNTTLLLGFARKCILFMTSKTRKFLLEYPLTHLRRYAYHKENQTLTLDFGDYEQGRFVFQTPEAEEISMYLSDYIDYIQTKLVGSHSFSLSDDHNLN